MQDLITLTLNSDKSATLRHFKKGSFGVEIDCSILQYASMYDATDDLIMLHVKGIVTRPIVNSEKHDGIYRPVFTCMPMAGELPYPAQQLQSAA